MGETMKKYHPVAHVVDLGGNVTGVLLQEKCGPKAGTGLAVYTSWGKFLELVALEEVQLFSLQGGNLEVSYDNEGFKLPKKFPRLTLEEYWNSDATFNRDGIELENCVNVSLLATREMFKRPFSVLSIWYSTQISSEVQEQIRKASLSVTASAPNLLVVQALPEIIQSCLKQLQCPVCVNVDTHVCRDNIIYHTKQPMVKAVTDEAILKQTEIDFLNCSHGGPNVRPEGVKSAQAVTRLTLD